MAETPFRAPKALSVIIACCLLSGVGSALAQDWNPFSDDQRGARSAPPPRERGGPRPGDRPLEMPDGRRDGTTYGSPATRHGPERGSGSGWGQGTGGRGAGAVSVEREELAPIPTEPSAMPPPIDRTPPPQWDARVTPPDGAPPDRNPYSSRDRGPEPWGVRPQPRSGFPERPAGRSQPAPARADLGGLADIDAKTLEDIVAGLELPSKSATVAALWPRIWADAGRGAPLSPALEGIRIETLTRSGDVAALARVLAGSSAPSEPVLAIVVLRARLLTGDREAGCALAGEAIRNRAALPPSFRRDAVLAAGACAMAGGNAEAAKLTANLIRGESLDAPFAVAVLEGTGRDGKAAPPLPRHVGTLDYRIGEFVGLEWPQELVDRATPGVLAVIAAASTLDPGLRVVAAERAARLNLIPPDSLAEQYRGVPHAADEMAHPLASRLSGALKRSVLFQGVEAERAPDKKARLVRALLDEAGSAGLGSAVARMLGPTIERMPTVPEIGWFGETAIDVLVQAGRGEAAQVWIDGSRGHLEHWRVLAWLAGEGAQLRRDTGLGDVERLAAAGRFEASLLHRLVTVLDALDVQIPIPLWEAASRMPQPTDGYLPPTGVLADLKSARDKGDGARIVLRVAQALGPASAADANLLTLGDAIRALKSVGLDREARALGLEALIASWPRTR